MRAYSGYLIDLDGTLYKGEELIPDAPDFIHHLRKAEIPFLFLTNNSTRSPEQVAQKLNEMGISAYAEEVFTTSMATANFLLKQKPGASIYVVGEEGLQQALSHADFRILQGREGEHAEYVIVGLDRAVTYEKLAIACLAIRNGAAFIGTNADIALPTERGFMPGAGSIIQLVATSTERKPIYIGKPESLIVELALEELKVPKEQTVLIGDNLYTDILAGHQSGMDTILVYSGITRPEHVEASSLKPTYTFQTLSEILPFISRVC